MKHLGVNELTINGTIYVSFGDIRDALSAYTKVETLRSNWFVDCIGTSRYFEKQFPRSGLPGFVFEGQISVRAEYGGVASQFSAHGIGNVVNEVLENYGEIMGMETTEVTPLSATYRAEYYDSAAVPKVVAALQGFKISVSPQESHSRSLLTRVGLHSGHLGV